MSGPTGQGGIGGAVYVDGVSQNAEHARFRLEHSEILDSGANDHGGGIFLYTIESAASELLLNSSRFGGNRITGTAPRVGFAGGIYVQNGALTISSCTFDGNSSVSMGGAVWWLSSLPALVVNSTFSANRSGNFASALQVSGPLRLANCTLVGNQADGTFGGALRSGNPDQVWLRNMVFSGNSCPAQGAVADVSGTCQDGGGNLQWPHASGRIPVCAGVVWADPLLGALGDHGGPCPTHLPLCKARWWMVAWMGMRLRWTSGDGPALGGPTRGRSNIRRGGKGNVSGSDPGSGRERGGRGRRFFAVTGAMKRRPVRPVRA